MRSTKKKDKPNISILLIKNEKFKNLNILLNKINNFQKLFNIEIIILSIDTEFPVIEGNSSLKNKKIKLINKIKKSELLNSIKKLIIESSSELIAVMEGDGQYDPNSLISAFDKLIKNNLDLVLGSRFNYSSEIKGLNKTRKKISKITNKLGKYCLSNKYSHITDCMTGFFVLRQTVCKRLINKIEIDGFNFIFEFLAISKGNLSIGEIPLILDANLNDKTKIELPILWNFVISILHNLSFKLLPRRAISFGLIGISGIIIQLSITYFLMSIKNLDFEQVIFFSILVSATSNFLINNSLTFRSNKLRGNLLLIGLIRFLFITSIPLIANFALTTAFYTYILGNAFWAQIFGIAICFIWNYIASTKFVWKKT